MLSCSLENLRTDVDSENLDHERERGPITCKGTGVQWREKEIQTGKSLGGK